MPCSSLDEQRAYQNRWMQQRRADWIAANGPCRLCGSNENLEVDHIDPKMKSMNPAQIWSRRLEARELELAKCQVLCHVCHVAKRDNIRYGEDHGRAKLTNEQARTIFERLANGDSQGSIAVDFGISNKTVSAMHCGRIWRSLSVDEKTRTSKEFAPH